MRLLIRVRRHAHLERLQLLAGFVGQLLKRAIVEPLAQGLDERAVELLQPIDQRVARLAANGLRFRARRVELADKVVEHGIERAIASRAKRRQARDDAVQMCRQASPTSLTHLTCPTRRRHANRSPPLVEHVEDIGLAELDRHGPPAPLLRLAALDTPIDAMHHDLQRNATPEPPLDQVEPWSKNLNQTPFVLATQISFYLSAVLPQFLYLGIGIWDLGFGICRHANHRTSPEPTLTIRSSMRTSSAPLASMSCATPRRTPWSASHSTGRPMCRAARARHALSTASLEPRRSISYRCASVARHSASTSPRSTPRPSSSSMDVARAATSGGYAAGRRLMPKPTTTWSPAADDPVSARMPASLREPA